MLFRQDLRNSQHKNISHVRQFQSEILSPLPSIFLPMKVNDSGMDEIWQDFYASLPKKTADPERAALQRQLKKERESLIHFAWFYNSIARNCLT